MCGGSAAENHGDGVDVVVEDDSRPHKPSVFEVIAGESGEKRKNEKNKEQKNRKGRKIEAREKKNKRGCPFDPSQLEKEDGMEWMQEEVREGMQE